MNTLVAKNCVVTLDYHVTDPDGEVVDEGREPLIYLHGGYDDIFPLIEESLQGKKIPNFTRVETHGYPIMGWTRGIIDTNSPSVFSFETHPWPAKAQ